MGGRQYDAVVVGAGVIGLTVGVCLAEQGLRVQVYARDMPASTTSAVASAMVGPSFSPGTAGEWERDGITTFTDLADVDGTGVTVRSGRLAGRRTSEPLPGLETCPAEEWPEGFTMAARATLPIVDMGVYLDYLGRRLTDAGGYIEQRAVASLDEVAGEAPLLANCTGLGARELVGDPTVRPVRGQQVVVTNPGVDEFFLSSPYEPEWTAYWPHPGHVVLGGSQGEDDENTEPDPELAESILSRCRAVEPRLHDAEVIGHQVGLRPARPSVRLEVEQIGDSRRVHDYGHGGVGVTLSWGTAREAAALLLADFCTTV